MKILKELRKDIYRNAEYCKKEPETIKKNKEKIENSFAEKKSSTKASEIQNEHCRRMNK